MSDVMVDSLTWPRAIIEEIVQKVPAVKIGTKGGLRMRETDAFRCQPELLVEEEMRAAFAEQPFTLGLTPSFGNTPVLMSAAASPAVGLMTGQQTPEAPDPASTLL